MEDEVRSEEVGLVESVRGVLTAPIGDAGLGPVRGAMAAAITSLLAVLVPIVVLISSDDLFLESGFGILAGMTATLTYSGYVLIRSLRRGEARKQLDGADPHDKVDETQTFLVDFIGAAVMAFMFTWLAPARPFILEAGQDLLAWALTAGMAVVCVAGLASLREGVFRAIGLSSALRDVEAWDPSDALASEVSVLEPEAPGKMRSTTDLQSTCTPRTRYPCEE